MDLRFFGSPLWTLFVVRKTERENRHREGLYRERERERERERIETEKKRETIETE